jgi:hypothetical protein
MTGEAAQTASDRAFRAAVDVSHHTSWDTNRDIARVLVHAAEVAYGLPPGVRPHEPNGTDILPPCPECVEAKAYATMLRAALEGWNEAHPRL